MTRLACLFTVWVVLAASASCEPAMTGEQFDAYTRSKTLSFFDNFTRYGAEQYLTRRRVIWSYGDGDCVDGRWNEPEPGLICFRYETADPTPQCWHFFRTPTGLQARFVSPDSNMVLYETDASSAPLYCVGPKVGT